MSAPSLNDLLQLADAIGDVDLKEKLVEVGGTRTMRLWQYQAIKARFESKRAAYVDWLLQCDVHERTDVVRKVSSEIDQLDWNSGGTPTPGSKYLRSHLIPYLNRQTRMPPFIRASLKAVDKAFLVIASLAVFGPLIYLLASHLYRLAQSH